MKTNKLVILNGLNKTEKQYKKQVARWQRRNPNRKSARIQISKSTAILFEENGQKEYPSNYKFS